MTKAEQFFKISVSEYDAYARAAWQRYLSAPVRAEASLASVAGIQIARALDIGCGAGHELIPFVTRLGALGVGVDVVEGTGRAGRELFTAYDANARVYFVRAAAEALPFQPGCFDVIICRLALPYTENDRALAEMARVLRPGGVIMLKIHHAVYYLRKVVVGLRACDALSVIHALRVLAAGVIYHVTCRQPRTPALCWHCC